GSGWGGGWGIGRLGIVGGKAIGDVEVAQLLSHGDGMAGMGGPGSASILGSYAGSSAARVRMHVAGGDPFLSADIAVDAGRRPDDVLDVAGTISVLLAVIGRKSLFGAATIAECSRPVDCRGAPG